MNPAADALHPARRTRHVAHLRLRRAGGSAAGSTADAGADPAGTPAWRAGLEDLLRCADLGDQRRVLLLRRLSLPAGLLTPLPGGGLAPGATAAFERHWQALIARARPGSDPQAARAEALVFEDWDAALGAWLAAVLAGPPEAAPPAALRQAWHWRQLARLADPDGRAGLSGLGERQPWPATAAELARRIWTLWQRDPASRRAAAQWWQAQAPAARALLAPAGPSANTGADAGTATAAPTATDLAATAPPDAATTPAASTLAPARHEADEGVEARPNAAAFPETMSGEATVDAARPPSPPLADFRPHARPPTPDAAPSTPSPAMEAGAGPEAAGSTVRVAAARAPAVAVPRSSAASATPGAGADPVVPVDRQGERPLTPQVSSDQERARPADEPAVVNRTPTAPAASRAVAQAPAHPRPAPAPLDSPWGLLRPSLCGGWPMTLNLLVQLGGLARLAGLAQARGTDPATAERALQQALSSPWLAALAAARRAGGPAAAARQDADPLWPVLPAVEQAMAAGLAPPQALRQAIAGQPAWARAAGRSAWCAMGAALRRVGAGRHAGALLQRPAWVALSATHLDVVIPLDEADPALRRLGLDLDPGWVPALGRIVAIHFEDLPGAARAWAQQEGGA